MKVMKVMIYVEYDVLIKSNIRQCLKSVRIRSYSGPYIPVFSPNAGKYGPK